VLSDQKKREFSRKMVHITLFDLDERVHFIE